MEEFSISVIVPARNRRDTIIRAIDSALIQTFPPKEVIVVDDGSTDGTVEAVMSHGYGDRVRVFVNPVSGGACKARNRGASLASGNCIAFLDSDDAWHPEKLAEQVRVLGMHPEVPAVFTNFEYVGTTGPVKRSQTPEVVTLEALFEHNVLGGCSAAMVRKSAFDKVGGFDPDLPSCQDWDLWIRLAEIGPIYCLKDCYTLYYFDGSDRISSNTAKVIAGHNVLFDRIYRKLPESVSLNYIKKTHKYLMARTAFYSLGDRSVSLKYSKMAIRDPQSFRSFVSSLKIYALHFKMVERAFSFFK